MSKAEDKLKELAQQLDALKETANQIEAPTEEMVELPALPNAPTEQDLDQFESMYVDAIVWREEAAELKVKLGKSEFEATKVMRQNLMTKIVARLNVDLNTQVVSINRDSRKVTILKK